MAGSSIPFILKQEEAMNDFKRGVVQSGMCLP